MQLQKKEPELRGGGSVACPQKGTSDYVTKCFQSVTTEITTKITEIITKRPTCFGMFH